MKKGTIFTAAYDCQRKGTVFATLVAISKGMAEVTECFILPLAEDKASQELGKRKRISGLEYVRVVEG